MNPPAQTIDPRAPQPALPNLGDVFAGKYRIESVLGAGGMGVVFGALHTSLGERVAIKLLRPEQIEDQETVARFLREAQAAARIRGDHVARVVDVGEAQSGLPYIVFEHLEGRDLAAHLKINGRMGVAQSVDWLLETCEALAEAHAMGIIHRDLKPSNLFLAMRPDGSLSIKVLDFGISKLGDGQTPSMTRTAAVFGSPSYMSPEQVKSSKLVDARSDIWSLGVVIYELLTGNIPFAGDSAVEITASVLREEPPPLRNAVPDLPAALEAVCLKCLRKKPDDRFATVGELAASLAPFATAAARESVARISRILARGARVLPAAATSQAGTAHASPGHQPRRFGTGTLPLVASPYPGSAAVQSGEGLPVPPPAYGALAADAAGAETVLVPPPIRNAIIVAAAVFGLVVAIGLALILRFSPRGSHHHERVPSGASSK